MKINIESQFNVEQKVFCIEEYTSHSVCETCNGEKSVEVTINNQKRTIQCPDCGGTGDGEYQLELWRLKCGNKPWSIGAIFLSMWKYKDCKPEFRYEVTYSHDGCGNTSTSVDEEDCFNTLQEALDKIAERNLKPNYVDDSE